jgi:opacity protein-like surface antigen
VKRLGLMLVVAVAVSLCAALPVVQAADDVSSSSSDTALSFDPGTVRFGYADGYWDNDHHWHGWPSAREAREFHRRFRDRIYGYRHTRYPNDGWRDGDDNGQRRVSDPAKPMAPEQRTEPHS